MKPVCNLNAGSLSRIELSEISAQDKITAERLFDDFANSREGVGRSQIARDLIYSIDHGSISIESLKILSKHCHTRGSWAPCIAPASAISKWLTGMVIPRLIDKNHQPVADYQKICDLIVKSVEMQA